MTTKHTQLTPSSPAHPFFTLKSCLWMYQRVKNAPTSPAQALLLPSSHHQQASPLQNAIPIPHPQVPSFLTASSDVWWDTHQWESLQGWDAHSFHLHALLPSLLACVGHSLVRERRYQPTLQGRYPCFAFPSRNVVGPVVYQLHGPCSVPNYVQPLLEATLPSASAHGKTQGGTGPRNASGTGRSPMGRFPPSKCHNFWTGRTADM